MRKVLAVALVVLVLAAGAVPAYAALSSPLSTTGPTTVSGTDASAVFQVADRTVRQVRYVDRGVLEYEFTLVNEGALPLRVTGLGAVPRKPTLFTYEELVDGTGAREFTVGAGEREVVRLSMLMSACERLSARAGSFASEVPLEIERLGAFEKVVSITLPEELHTGSAREAACPGATAESRPPG